MKKYIHAHKSGFLSSKILNLKIFLIYRKMHWIQHITVYNFCRLLRGPPNISLNFPISYTLKLKKFESLVRPVNKEIQVKIITPFLMGNVRKGSASTEELLEKINITKLKKQ